MIYDNISTIRYMGTKTKLLTEIIPAIKSVTPLNGTVCDIMAGSNAVSYALKRFFTVYTNDIQNYSAVISKAIIENQNITINKELAIRDLTTNYKYNLRESIFHFFTDTYSFTYFSDLQCADIDSIRFAIEKITNVYKRNLYIFALMTTMCKIQSTPGHFAQFMDKDHDRIIPLQKLSAWEEFLNKCNDYSDLIFTNNKNKVFCEDYKTLLNSGVLNDIDTIYLDSPYSQEQYSRFYHILETLVLYDSPTVNYKAKYRDDRFMSNFCYKTKVKNEFETIISFCKKNKINLVISYSTNAILPVQDLLNLCKNHFNNVSLNEIYYSHSTQGKGNNKIKEVIIVLAN